MASAKFLVNLFVISYIATTIQALRCYDCDQCDDGNDPKIVECPRYKDRCLVSFTNFWIFDKFLGKLI